MSVLWKYIDAYKTTPTAGSRPVQIHLNAFPLVRGDETTESPERPPGMSVVARRIPDERGRIMTTGTITTYAARPIGGIAGLAVRAGHALEDWGRRVAEPADARAARTAHRDRARGPRGRHRRGDAHAGAYQLLR